VSSHELAALQAIPGGNRLAGEIESVPPKE
jgi:hypothetical protein